MATRDALIITANTRRPSVNLDANANVQIPTGTGGEWLDADPGRLH
jgi:hypothetical protein